MDLKLEIRYLVYVLVLLSSCNNNKSFTVEIIDKIDTSLTNINYVSNKKPLVPQTLIKLPTGSIRPGGWLLTQLNLQKEGLNGRLGEISAWLQKDNNAWLTSGGKWGWEEVPYWLRGYSSLAFTLQDKKLLEESKVWIEAILNSQREDGNFGPYVENHGAQDFWPNMVALWILQSYYEFSNDERILDFMTKYFHYQLTVPDNKFLQSYWENSRGGDNLWSIVWLYNRTGDAKLLDLAEKLHKNTADWTKDSELPNWHNVNIAQCFREPATYYLFNGNPDMLRASYNVQHLARNTCGQVPGGMFGADENARIGFFDPRQGTETCGFAEQMASDEIMLLITGDMYWAENCEDVAFNSYPAAIMPDYKSLRYLTSPNMIQSDSKNHAPGIQNEGPFLAMNPFSSRCCQHNHGFAWPYYAEHLLLATPDNGIAAVLYNSCEAKVLVSKEKMIKIVEDTDYPFDSKIKFSIAVESDTVKFPFYMRIPSWTDEASASINGEMISQELIPGKYLCIDRIWRNGDIVELNLPMDISYRQWQVNKNSISVDYGPLTLSLLIKEKYIKKNSAETAIWDSQWQKGVNHENWPTYEIYADSPWNYALLKGSVKLMENRGLADGVNPFTLNSSPLKFKAKGRKVPEWQMDGYGLCGVLPYENAEKSDILEEIELIPMGAARLRISAFPQCK